MWPSSTFLQRPIGSSKYCKQILQQSKNKIKREGPILLGTLAQLAKWPAQPTSPLLQPATGTQGIVAPICRPCHAWRPSPASQMSTRAPQAPALSPGRTLAASPSSPSCRDLLCSHRPSDTVAMPPPQTRPPASPSPETATRRTATFDFVHPEHQIERRLTESPPWSSSSTSCTSGRHRRFAQHRPSPASPTTFTAPW